MQACEGVQTWFLLYESQMRCTFTTLSLNTLTLCLDTYSTHYVMDWQWTKAMDVNNELQKWPTSFVGQWAGFGAVLLQICTLIQMYVPSAVCELFFLSMMLTNWLFLQRGRMTANTAKGQAPHTDHSQPSAPSMGPIIKLVVLYHDLSVSTASAGGRWQGLDDAHVQTHTLLPSKCAAISGSRAGSQGAVTGLLGLPETLSISSLIPSCLSWSGQLQGVYTATTRKEQWNTTGKSTCNNRGWTC